MFCATLPMWPTVLADSPAALVEIVLMRRMCLWVAGLNVMGLDVGSVILVKFSAWLWSALDT